VARLVTVSIFHYPKSSALHNLCQACLISDSWSSEEVEEILTIFAPQAVKFLEVSEKTSGGCYGHVCRIFDRCVSQLGEVNIRKIFPNDSDIILAAARRWSREIDSRLADTVTTGAAVNSPRSVAHGITPIVDFGIDDNDCVAPIGDSPENDWSSSSARMVRSAGSISDDEDNESPKRPSGRKKKNT
jgi:hypothetical protein